VPHDATWRGASGNGVCRIADVSRSGCFVQCLATPTAGERTEITLLAQEQPVVTLRARVIYSVRGIGFAVEFADNPEPALAALERHLDQLSDQNR
jgi:hypothetical protein